MTSKIWCSSKQADFILGLAQETGERIPELAIGRSSRAASDLISQLIETRNARKAEARRAAAQARTAQANADGPVTVEGVVTRDVLQESYFGGVTRKLEVTSDHGNKYVVTFPAAIERTYGHAIYRALVEGTEVRVRIVGLLTYGSNGTAYTKRAKGQKAPLVELLTSLPTDDQLRLADDAWQVLRSTEVVGERLVRCCSHADHQGQACYASVQVMSDEWDTCGCRHWEVTTVPGETTVTEPKPDIVALVAWYDGLTEAERKGAEAAYGLLKGIGTMSWILRGTGSDNPDYAKRCWEQLNYVGV